MSHAGSVISAVSSASSGGGIATSSLLQTCVYVKDYLQLDVYKDLNATTTYHVKISSKTLKASYVLPGDGCGDSGDGEEERSGPSSSSCIAGLFERLAELVKGLKEKNLKPPKSDFVCFSALKYNKVFLDVDCVSCKSGHTITDKRHFSSTKLLNVILSTVGRVFDTQLDNSVYVTNGKSTCGYHIFFNSLAYRHEDAAATKEMLFRELDFTIARANFNNISIDRNCTQMPLPTSRHTDSLHYTTPYRMTRICKDQWKRETMRWHDMDAELLKCFSCIAFSRNHSWTAVPKTNLAPQPPPPPPPPPASPQSPATIAEIADDMASVAVSSTGDRKRKADETSHADASVTEVVESTKRIRTTSTDALPVVAIDELEQDHSVLTEYTSGGDCRSFVVPVVLLNDVEQNKPFISTVGEKENEKEEDDKLSAITEDTFGVGGAASFFLPGQSVKEAVGLHATVSPLDPLENSEADATSFVVPLDALPLPTVLGGGGARALKRNVGHVRYTTRTTTTTTAADTIDGGSPCKFVDKQYKNSLLRAEEDDATRSRVNLTSRSGEDPPRIYVLPGTSIEKTRKYKLLVRLENVERAVYAGDKFRKREWTDIKVAYYDHHVNNPVILKIFDFVFKDDRVKALFDRSDLDLIHQSITHLMTPFEMKKRHDTRAEGVVFPHAIKRAEKESRTCKSLLIGALTRVCTDLFVMITAVVSDFRKIQIMNKYRNQTLLNCTVAYDRHNNIVGNDTSSIYDYENRVETNGNEEEDDDDDDEDGPDCSASTFGCSAGERIDAAAENRRPSDKKETLYALLASLIVYEKNNLSDHALYAILYYYHYFPTNTITKLMNEVQHDGLMVTVMIRYFLVYEHRRKPLTLLEIFHGFNDVTISLWGPEKYLSMKKKNVKKDATKSSGNQSNNGGGGSGKQNNRNPNPPRRSRNASTTENFDDSSNNSLGSSGCDDNSATNSAVGATAAATTNVTQDEVDKLLSGHERRRKMVSQRNRLPGEEECVTYEWKEKHMWQAIVNYYLRPVVMHDDRLVFANDGYDTIEEDAIESCVAHVVMSDKITKADVATAFRDARTLWRMPHGSQLIYESDLVSENIGCCFHINAALKIYETFCGGCLTRMKRVHNNYLVDNTRFNMNVYDVVAECRTATVDLTTAVDRSYVNLLLCQPVVPAVFEDIETRRLFMSDDEMKRGSFCCLSTMDYIRALNLFDRANCQSKFELETCDYVERFLDDVYTGEIAADGPPNVSADARTKLLYAFYSLFIYEVTFHMRHAYATRENCFVSIERLCGELDVRELLVLFFGESGMTHVDGLPDDVERRIRKTADELSAKKLSSAAVETARGEHGNRFDVRPVLAADIPDKVARMKALFGQFGFDIMRENAIGTYEDGERGGGRSTSDETVTDYADAGDVAATITTTTTTAAAAATMPPDWSDENNFENLFYANDDWLENLYRRVSDKEMTGKNSRNVPTLASSSSSFSSGKGKAAGRSRYGGGGGAERLFLTETTRTVMRLQLKRHVDHDRLGKLFAAVGDPAFNRTLAAMRSLPMRLKLLALVLTTHTVKLKTTRLAADFVDHTYRDPFNNEVGECCGRDRVDTPERVWFKRTEAVLEDRRALLLHLRWLAEKRFKQNFFVGLDPVLVYDVLYEYMRCNQTEYPAFKRYNKNGDTRVTAQHLCTAMMFLLVMSAYDQEVLELYLKMFLAVEWPGQWAKTIFVWKSNSNAGKSYLFDAIIKRACANSTCINDPKGGKENAPEKAEYVRNFVLFANEFSQANSNELKKIVSESTFKFRMNYGNMMNEIYATGKIMVNCNTLPPTSDEAAINRLTLFSMPFWFSKRQSISDALLNWTRCHNVSDRDHWELAYRYELPSLFTDKETEFLKSHDNTKNEADLFDGYAALRPNMFSGNMDFSKATASLFLVQNKISRLYVSSAPPTEQIVHGLVNITRHFSWLRFFNRLDTPVDFTTLPATSEAVRSEWLSLTLPYQEWKLATGARHDPTCRAPVATINRSLQAFAAKKNVNYFGIRQFFETDFASSREAIEDVYYVRFDTKVFTE